MSLNSIENKRKRLYW